MSRRALLARSLGALGAAALGGRPAPAEARPPEPLPLPPPLPVDVAVAAFDPAAGAPPGSAPTPVRDRAWIEAQLAEAARLFGPHGVSFVLAGVRGLPGRHARLETRDDRDALSAELRRGVIQVFVVASLRDVDDPSLLRMGVHWRYRREPARRYVIVAASAGRSTLAHELGHYLGNPHTSVVDNLMSYQRSDGGTVFLDDKQGKRSLATARRLLRAKELVPLPP
jgi:hypothetical protein